MEFERIQVITRDEYRGAQEPVYFHWRGASFMIEEILDRWYEGRLESRCAPMRYFRVRVLSGQVFMIRYHELFDAWSLLIASETGQDSNENVSRETLL